MPFPDANPYFEIMCIFQYHISHQETREFSILHVRIQFKLTYTLNEFGIKDKSIEADTHNTGT